MSDADSSAFRCEVCRVFCTEYADAIDDKKGDVDYVIAVDHARGNASNYRWDRQRHVLRPPSQGFGEPATDSIYELLDGEVLTHYNVQVVMNALHAAAHLELPPKLPWHFCRRVLCDWHLDHCEKDHDDRPYGSLTANYRHLKHEFDSRHTNPMEEHHRRGAHGSHASVITREYEDSHGTFDPAAMDPDVEIEMQRRLADQGDRVDHFGEPGSGGDEL